MSLCQPHGYCPGLMTIWQVQDGWLISFKVYVPGVRSKSSIQCGLAVVSAFCFTEDPSCRVKISVRFLNVVAFRTYKKCLPGDARVICFGRKPLGLSSVTSVSTKVPFGG